ncbi:putative metal-binding motif-containing protein [Myxococcota bacterium]|nr:putative metal-binding motif-containing protein [Myxococcota bacterium]
MRLALLPLLLTSCLTSREEYDALVLRALDGDGDGFFAEAHDGSDCDDEDPAVHPDALEVCDLKDNDCDGESDEGFTLMWYLDADGDGYGDPGSPFEGCSPPARYVSQGEDCDDTDATVNPSTVWYYDSDGDGFGIDSPRRYACEAPEGFAPKNGDCDDFDDAVHPGAEEPCDEAVDYNCDGAVGFSDGDGDGVPACEDCDDSRAEVAPDAPETCDGLDNDCDRDVDEAVLKTFYRDLDGDSYGDALTSQEACEAPAGWVADDEDCDDTDALVSPGQEEFFEEMSDAGSWDYNCDGRNEKKYGTQSGSCALDETSGDCDGEGFVGLVPPCGAEGRVIVCINECTSPVGKSDFIQPCR